MSIEELPKTWELVSNDSNILTKRLRVLGGWVLFMLDTVNQIPVTTFIPDPQHLWTAV